MGRLAERGPASAERINDQHGHETGDLVLQHVAQLAQAQLRSGDLLARYGGEEFIALLPDCDDQAGQALAERLRQAIQQQPPRLPDGDLLNLNASFGLAARRPASRPGCPTCSTVPTPPSTKSRPRAATRCSWGPEQTDGWAEGRAPLSA